MVLEQLPIVFNFHLKRFRWQNIHRDKLTQRVAFPLELDMGPFVADGGAGSHLYQLSAVVIHEGRSIMSGHYKCITYNTALDRWLLTNDARVSAVSVEELLRAEAYILFYVRKAAADVAFSRLSDILPTPAISP
jgi:ubiquitin C-terminal hydrolase